MAETGLKLESATVQRLADGRFLGQGFDLVVPLPPGPYDDSAPGRAAAPRRVRDRVSREVRADPAGRAGGVHQYPGGGAGARLGERRRARGPPRRRRARRAQGHAAGLLPGRGRAGWRPRCTTAIAWGSATSWPGPRWWRRRAPRWWSGPGATARVAASGNIVMTLEARMTSAPFDAITLEVLWTRIISVVDEAAKAIVRTSFSTLSNEANDFACVLTDARGLRAGPELGQHPVLHRHAARDRPALPARDRRRSTCGPATC